MKKLIIIPIIITGLFLVGCSTVEPLSSVQTSTDFRVIEIPVAPEPEKFVVSTETKTLVLPEAEVIDHEPVGETPAPEPLYLDAEEERVPGTIFHEFGSSKEFVLSDGFFHEDTTSRPKENALQNPTYDEVRTFLARDKTDEIEYTGKKSKVYSGQEWMCADYSSTFRENANKEGMRSAVVVLYLATVADPDTDVTTHSLVAFETTDKGMVYIEPQDDEFRTTVRQGQIFPEPPNTSFRIGPTYNVIRKVVVLW